MRQHPSNERLNRGDNRHKRLRWFLRKTAQVGAANLGMSSGYRGLAVKAGHSGRLPRNRRLHFMKQLRALLSTTIALAALAGSARAQVTITPMIGGYVPASDMHQVTGTAQDLAKTRDGTLSLGANVDFGMLRGTVMYASGTTIKNANEADIGKGSVLAMAADVVVRPLPRLLVQPYVLGGGGQKFYRYDQTTTFTQANNSDFAFHYGLGADMMMGKLGVAAELTDFLSKGVEDKWNVHDAFLMVGFKFRLGQ